MKELSNQARAALQTLGSVEPTAADERRVREGFERAMGVALPAAVVLGSATVASSATAAGMSSGGAAGASAGAASAGVAGFTALGVGAKVMLFVAAVGLGSVATVGVQAVVPQPAPVRSVVKPAVQQPTVRPPVAKTPVVPVVVVPEPIVVPEEALANAEPQPVTPISAAPKFSARRTRDPEAEAEKLEPTPQATVVAPPVAATPELTAPPPPPMPAAAPTPESATTEAGFDLVVEAHFPSCDASTELRTALAARRLLRESRAEHALFLIGAYQKHCASGQWSDEAWRVRLSSLCSLGRNTEAASLWNWFATEYPNRRTAIESELRSTCEATVLEHESISGE